MSTPQKPEINNTEPKPPDAPKSEDKTKLIVIAACILGGFMLLSVLLLGGLGIAYVKVTQSPQQNNPRNGGFSSAVVSSIQNEKDATHIQSMYYQCESILRRDAQRITPDGGPAGVVDRDTVVSKMSSFFEACSHDWQLSEKYPDLHLAILNRFGEAGLRDNNESVDLLKLADVCHDVHTALGKVSGVEMSELSQGPISAGFSLLAWLAVSVIVVFLVIVFAVGYKTVRWAFGPAKIVLIAVLIACASDNCEAQPQIEIDGVKYPLGYDAENGPRFARQLAEKTDRLYSSDVRNVITETTEIKTVLLWTYFSKVGADPTAWNQEWLGSCVGFGSARAASNRECIEIAELGKPWQWVGGVSPGWVYAASRTITQTNDNGQGSTGAWAAEALTKWGSCFARQYDRYDLRKYDPQQILKWQREGVPRALIDAAKPFPVLSCYRVKSVEEAKVFINNGVPLYTCSTLGYGNGARDQHGFCQRSGRWPHCMMIDGYRLPSTGREGFHQTNSWGPGFGSGPKWPDHMPDGSWWISVQDMSSQIAAGDTWAIGGVTGFKRLRIKVHDALDFGGKTLKESENRVKRKRRREVSVTKPDHVAIAL